MLTDMFFINNYLVSFIVFLFYFYDYILLFFSFKIVKFLFLLYCIYFFFKSFYVSLNNSFISNLFLSNLLIDYNKKLDLFSLNKLMSSFALDKKYYYNFLESFNLLNSVIINILSLKKSFLYSFFLQRVFLYVFIFISIFLVNYLYLFNYILLLLYFSFIIIHFWQLYSHFLEDYFKSIFVIKEKTYYLFCFLLIISFYFFI